MLLAEGHVCGNHSCYETRDVSGIEMLSLERSILTMQRANNPSSGSQLVAPTLIYNLYKGIKQNKTLWRSVAHYKGSQSTNLSIIVEYTEWAASVCIKVQESVEVHLAGVIHALDENVNVQVILLDFLILDPGK